MKTCAACKVTKALSEFYSKRSGAQGVAGRCKPCICSDMSHRHNQNREHNVTRMRKYRDANLEYSRWFDRNRYALDKEARQAKTKNWRSKFPEKQKESERSWRQRNKAHKYELVARRRAAKLRASPQWLTYDQIQSIREVYRTCPKGYHVDHIIPLNGENVSGLHVPWNLQHLPAIDNLRKGRKVV